MKQLTALFLLVSLALPAAAAQRPQRRPAGAPQAPLIFVLAEDGAAAALTPAMEGVLSEAGFEVMREASDATPAATLILRATPGGQPLVVFDGEASRAMAGAWQRGVPGARMMDCSGCLGRRETPALLIDLGDAVSPSSQMDAALAVRDALRPLAAGGERSAPKAEMAAPAPGSTLSGSSVTFQWSAGDQAAQYWLMIGTWLGGDTLYSADQGLLTSAPVSGLPMDGRAIYVRLWSHINGAWVSNDYQYKANGANGVTPVKAAVTAPAAGATLPGATATFQWNAGTGVSRYYFFVGLWQGANSIFGQDMGTNQQATVTNLPVDGSTLYVRLWSYIDTGWQYNDYTYKAAGTLTPVKAAMTAPAAGSTLAGTSATFQWSAGSGVARYHLFVGLWQGGNTLFSQDMGTSLSASVAGLPNDASKLYVRLWSYAGGTWQYNDYTYTASGTAPAAVKAQITAPAPGSTLSGASATFSWGGGSGVQRYWLMVGTAPGNNDIYGADQGTNTSATVGGLPVTGKVVYVRIWSYINGAWQSSDASYRAAGQ
jgi:hypothetical protein